MKIRLTLLALALAGLAGCATYPAPLQGGYTEMTAHQASSGDHTGLPVRWGGRIIAVEPGENRTCFQMLGIQLDGTGRPVRSSDRYDGRFLACRDGFYDPAIFQAGREVTFTGRIDGYEDREIGEYEYRLPRMAADVVYLWGIRERVDVIERPAPWPWWGWW
ncbi:Slp family lipoprotein [Novilysobacter defluvii]|uniref:Membrane protein n=1 Tax=Lysobacter defluvii IMMIB APB-9 = DSM 18482 TaxID=1385515 RepID=A0A0A0M493_9GAMM|nr:Slp family lipoprotein [Lysobacter defluvii]KGO97920.1 membrane protein [Lysobacter defluvii IMMIB APB-9 = DSM 18482]